MHQQEKKKKLVLLKKKKERKHRQSHTWRRNTENIVPLKEKRLISLPQESRNGREPFGTIVESRMQGKIDTELPPNDPVFPKTHSQSMCFVILNSSGLYSYQWLWSALRRKHWLYLYFHGWLYSCDHIKILRKWLEIQGEQREALLFPPVPELIPFILMAGVYFILLLPT